MKKFFQSIEVVLCFLGKCHNYGENMQKEEFICICKNM